VATHALAAMGSDAPQAVRSALARPPNGSCEDSRVVLRGAAAESAVGPARSETEAQSMAAASIRADAAEVSAVSTIEAHMAKCEARMARGYCKCTVL
jgi:hypothetical protein